MILHLNFSPVFAWELVFDLQISTFRKIDVAWAYSEATSGAIKGAVVPSNSHSIAYAIQNTTDTIGSAFADTTSGNFLIGGLSAGNYNVAIHSEGYADTTLPANVTTGAVTDLGTVQLHQ